MVLLQSCIENLSSGRDVKAHSYVRTGVRKLGNTKMHMTLAIKMLSNSNTDKQTNTCLVYVRSTDITEKM